jgi:hypothetical protein
VLYLQQKHWQIALCTALQASCAAAQAPHDLREGLKAAIAASHSAAAHAEISGALSPTRSGLGVQPPCACLGLPAGFGASSVAATTILQLPTPIAVVAHQPPVQEHAADGVMITTAKTRVPAWNGQIGAPGLLAVWDLTDTQQAHAFCAAESVLQCIAPGPEAAPHIVAGGSVDGTVYIWNLHGPLGPVDVLSEALGRVLWPSWSSSEQASSAVCDGRAAWPADLMQSLRFQVHAPGSDRSSVTLLVLSAWGSVSSWEVTSCHPSVVPAKTSLVPEKTGTQGFMHA